ncbi:MAG: 2-oxo acid dehydrogenase subunit E2 [Chromatocurvus sp.]
MTSISSVSMPKWGMEMTEGMIGDWHVAVGDSIAKGDDLVDVETSKIVNCVSAHTAGTLRRILAEPGELLPVGAPLAVIADAAASDDDIEAYIAGLATPGDADSDDSAARTSPQAGAPAPAPQQATTAEQGTPAVAAGTSDGGETSLPDSLQSDADDTGVAATPVARRIAAQSGVNLTRVEGTGRHNRVTLKDLEAAALAAGTRLTLPERSEVQITAVDDSDLPATPVARRLAKSLGVQLRDCKRTGSHGRVSKADVEARAAKLGRASGQPSAADTTEESLPFEEQALGGMRNTIARRLQASKQTAPHFRVKISASVDAAMELRQTINSQRSDLKVSLNDILIKASASALLAVPEVNIQFDGETVRRYRDADIAVAVALDDGLITPIIREANRKGLAAISSEMRDMATRARIGRLKAEEFEGGTFSVSNLGMFGVDEFDAIINPPQAAILAVGATERRPIERADGSWGGYTALTLTLSSDHRIIDGAVAARFLAALKGFIETPSTMLV